jgi:hypothetical protein
MTRAHVARRTAPPGSSHRACRTARVPVACRACVPAWSRNIRSTPMKVTGLVSVGDEALAELHGLRSDDRELIALLRGPVRADAARSEATPPMMTIAEVAEMLRTSTHAVYQQTRLGQVTGVVRLGNVASWGRCTSAFAASRAP